MGRNEIEISPRHQPTDLHVLLHVEGHLVVWHLCHGQAGVHLCTPGPGPRQAERKGGRKRGKKGRNEGERLNYCFFALPRHIKTHKCVGTSVWAQVCVGDLSVTLPTHPLAPTHPSSLSSPLLSFPSLCTYLIVCQEVVAELLHAAPVLVEAHDGVLAAQGGLQEVWGGGVVGWWWKGSGGVVGG